MKEKRFNVLDWAENVVVSNLTEEETKRFIDTYANEYNLFLIEEIHDGE